MGDEEENSRFPGQDAAWMERAVKIWAQWETHEEDLVYPKYSSLLKFGFQHHSFQQKTAKNTYENSCACIVSLIRTAWMKFCVTWNSTPTSQNLASVVPETQPMTDIHSGYIILAASCRKVQNYLRINLGHLAAVSVEHATIDLGVVSLNRMLSVKITFKNL